MKRMIIAGILGLVVLVSVNAYSRTKGKTVNVKSQYQAEVLQKDGLISDANVTIKVSKAEESTRRLQNQTKDRADVKNAIERSIADNPAAWLAKLVK